MELPNNVSNSVKGYTITNECLFCKSKRIKDNLERDIIEKSNRKLFVQNRIVQLIPEKERAESMEFTELVTSKNSELLSLQDELKIL